MGWHLLKTDVHAIRFMIKTAYKVVSGEHSAVERGKNIKKFRGLGGSISLGITFLQTNVTTFRFNFAPADLDACKSNECPGGKWRIFSSLCSAREKSRQWESTLPGFAKGQCGISGGEEEWKRIIAGGVAALSET